MCLSCTAAVHRGSYTFDQPAIEQGDKLVQATVTADALTVVTSPQVVVPPVTITVPNLPILFTSMLNTSCAIPNAAGGFPRTTVTMLAGGSDYLFIILQLAFVLEPAQL